jgi:transcription elongation factor GreA
MQRVPLTHTGEKQLRDELNQLKRVRRPAVIEAIAEARAHGDLKENAEYHAAKEEQGHIEARIRLLEQKLSQAQIIDITTIPYTGKVTFGTTVTLERQSDHQALTYKIVGEDESDVDQGKLSINSPIARSLIGKLKDDHVTVQTPKGYDEYKILKVEHLA